MVSTHFKWIPLKILGQVQLPIDIGGNVLMSLGVLVLSIAEAAILGMDFIATYKCTIDTENRTLSSTLEFP